MTCDGLLDIPLIESCLNIWETILSNIVQHPVQMVVSVNQMENQNGQICKM